MVWFLSGVFAAKNTPRLISELAGKQNGFPLSAQRTLRIKGTKVLTTNSRIIGLQVLNIKENYHRARKLAGGELH
jgi:hypothetical protein